MVTIQIVNGAEVAKNINLKAKNIVEFSKGAIIESGMLLKEEIEQSIDGNRAEPRSVDTGAFLASISSQEVDKGVEVATDKDYAKFLEYGTSYIEERRHFRNSLDRTTPVIIEKINTAIKNAID